MNYIEENRENLKKLGWSDELIDAFVRAEVELDLPVVESLDLPDLDTTVVVDIRW